MRIEPPQTPRLTLRELTLDDLDFVAEMLGHPEVMQHYPKPLSRGEAQLWIERSLARYRDHGHSFWLVSERSSGTPVGQVGLLLQEVDGRPEPEIGYLLHRPFWKRGYATEAALAVRDQAFTARGLDHVISLIRPVNLPSQAVARRLGMTPRRETLWKGIPCVVWRVERT